MVVIVPIEEALTETAGIFNRAEEFGELGLVFEGFEVGFGIRIVIRDMGTRMGFSHA